MNNMKRPTMEECPANTKKVKKEEEEVTEEKATEEEKAKQTTGEEYGAVVVSTFCSHDMYYHKHGYLRVPLGMEVPLEMCIMVERDNPVQLDAKEQKFIAELYKLYNNESMTGKATLAVVGDIIDNHLEPVEEAINKKYPILTTINILRYL
jgi:hypothetical protein